MRHSRVQNGRGRTSPEPMMEKLIQQAYDRGCTFLAAPDPQFSPATLALSNGRSVSNPLATTVRFAYGPDVTFRAQNRRPARPALSSLQFEF